MNRRPVRYTPVTRNGRTHHIPTDLPPLPRDWDHTVQTAVTIATTVLVCVSVAWSTASIGDLLARTVIAPLAYGAASAFDLVWIISMAVEWLARYDTNRARLPRIAGHISLAIAMGAVGVHGYLTGNWATAGIGAFVSALAKGGWTVVMHHQAVTLDPQTAAWLRAERAARGAARALAAEERVDARAAKQLAAIRESRALSGDAVAPSKSTLETEALAILEHRAYKQSGPDGTLVADSQALISQMHGPIVYFLGNGNRVKIGTSKNLAGRIATLCLRPEDLLFALHGGHDVEAALHQRFTEQRVGNSEWFEITGPLADYIAERTGQPLPASSDEAGAHQDASDASPDAPLVAEIPRIAPGVTKTAAILAASAALQPDASPASIALLLAQQGVAVDTAYIRTVLSRSKPKDADEVGKGGGGYA